MNDQASALREIVSNIKKHRERGAAGARIVTVTSGKGGVGKTSITVNLAIALSRRGFRVLIVDADFGLSNVDVIMGVTPAYDLSHVVRHAKDVQEVITEGLGGVRFVSGGSGVFDLINLSELQLARIMDNLLQMDDLADIILFDTGAGITNNILKLVSASQEVIVVVTPEPTAIMDAYAMVKTLMLGNPDAKVRVVVNRAESVAEAENTLAKFSAVVRLYLKSDLEELGYVLTDPVVSRAVRLQRPFILSYPKSTASRNVETIAGRLIGVEPESSQRGLRVFFDNLLRRTRT